MRKIAVAATAALMSATAYVPAVLAAGGAAWHGGEGTEDVDMGVLCKVKDVTVLAQTVEDCGKIGGTATHQVTNVKTPIE